MKPSWKSCCTKSHLEALSTGWLCSAFPSPRPFKNIKRCLKSRRSWNIWIGYMIHSSTNLCSTIIELGDTPWKNLEKEMATHLQCSCLENALDRGAWWAAVHGVAQSWTWLKQLSSSSMYGCESCTIKKAERWRNDAFELWCWRIFLRVSWTARRSN